jgi:hypothetical protein
MTKSTYTVDAMLEIYKEQLKSPFDESMITLEGFYLAGKGVKYGKVYYDFIQDQNKTVKMTMVVPERVRGYLSNGGYYILDGFLNKSLNVQDGSVRILFRANQVKDKKDEHQYISKDEFSIVQERFKRKIPHLSEYLINFFREEKKPKVNIITGQNSIVDEDFKSQLKDIDYYQIYEQRVNLSNPSATTKKIKEVKKGYSDLVVVMRGGGTGLEIFDDVEMCKASLSCQVPFVTAIGHKEDSPLLEKSADRGFATPTAFGSFLQSVVDDHKKQIKEKTLYEESISTLKKELASTQKDRDERLKKAELQIKGEIKRAKEEIQRNSESRDRFESIFKAKEQNYRYAVFALGFLLVVCLLIILL